LNLTGSERATLKKRYTDSGEAYQLYVKGRYYWNKRSISGMVEAQFHFRQAIERDPNFALAYVGLADTLLMETPEASLAVNKAIELDSTLGEAYATLGFAGMFRAWDWTKAEESFKRAIELNPGYGTSHQWYATLLAMTGRAAEAKEEMKRALEIDPLSHNFLADLGQMHYFAREYEEAERYCRKALQVNPDFHFAHEYLADIYTKTGRDDEAFEEHLSASKTFTRDPKYGKDGETGQQSLREVYRKSGMKGFLRNQIQSGVRDSFTGFSYFVAKFYALLGEKQEALSVAGEVLREQRLSCCVCECRADF
jgi:tetratricopeptide (TPR) repeat protein